MSKSLIELADEAKALGIKLNGKEDRKEIEDLILLKKPQSETGLTDEEVTRIKEEGKINEAKLKTSQQRSMEEKKYSEEDLKNLYDKWKKDDIAKENEENDPDKPIVRELTIPRFDNKFIVGFGNLNKDPFFPNKIVTSQMIFNDQTKQFIPNVEVIYDDDTPSKPSRLVVPFETILKVSSKITCKIIERRAKDASEKLGRIAVEDVSQNVQYNKIITGEVIQGKYKKVTETFLVETPDNRQLWVTPDVINWRPAPQTI